MMATIFLVLFAAIAFLYFAKSIFTPLVLSVFLCFLLDPLVSKLECKYFPRVVISPLLIILVVGLLSGGAWITFVTTAEISSHFPQYAEKAKAVTGFFIHKAEKLTEDNPKLFPTPKEDIQKVEIVRSVGDVTGYLLKWLDAIAGIMGSVFMVPILTLFFLIEKNRILEKLKTLPVLSHSGEELARKTAHVVQAFFIGNLIGGVVSSICFFAAFAILNLDNKIALSIGAGFLSLIPIVGAFIAMVFPVAQGLLQFESLAPFLTIILTSLLVHFVVANFIMPKIMGSRVDLNVIAATIGMLFWGWLWGAMGIFLAVPLTAIIKLLCDLNPKTKPFAIALSESEKPSSIMLVESLKSFKIIRTAHGIGIKFK